MRTDKVTYTGSTSMREGTLSLGKSRLRRHRERLAKQPFVPSFSQNQNPVEEVCQQGCAHWGNEKRTIKTTPHEVTSTEMKIRGPILRIKGIANG